MIKSHQAEDGLITVRDTDGEIIARREPGWYMPVRAKIDNVTIELELTSASVHRNQPLEIGVIVRSGGDMHKFTAESLYSIDGEAVIKCPDRPAVGYWRKVEELDAGPVMLSAADVVESWHGKATGAA